MDNRTNSAYRVIVFATVLGLGFQLGQRTPNREAHAESARVITLPAVPLVLAPPAATLAATALPDAGAAHDPRNVFVGVSRKTIPSVVNIFTTKFVKQPRWTGPMAFGGAGAMGEGSDQGQDLPELFEQFFGNRYPAHPGNRAQRAPQPLAQAPKAMSLGSGFIIEADGNGEALVMTNNHVIEGADEVRIKFTEAADESETDAKVIGTDPDLDVAILRVKTSRPLQAVHMGDSDKLEVGEWVEAVGNPFGHGHSVSHGIVSAKARTLPGGFGNYLQVDAPINPGNSGGPLVNLAGEVVGINNAIDGRATGIGFAIPINSAKAVVEQLKKSGRVERGYLGVNIGEVTPEIASQLKLGESIHGPIVMQVQESSPGAKAGLRPYDIITEVNAKPVYGPSDLINAIRSLQAGQKVELKIIRAGQTKSLAVTLSGKPTTEQS